MNLLSTWTVVGFKFDDPGNFDCLYKGESYEEALAVLTEATYEHDHVRMEYYKQ